MSLTPYVHLAEGALAEAGPGDVVPVPGEARSHLERVLRLRTGAPLVVADGQGREARATLGAGTAVLDGPVEVHEPPPVGLHLVQGLAKGRKTDDIVRSATELGVDRVTIVTSQRSVTKPPSEKRDRMLQRWRAVALAAAEQSRRPRLPVVDGPWSLDEFVASSSPAADGVIAHPSANWPLRTALADMPTTLGGELLAVVGPEGGWHDDEVEQLSALGLRPVHLGATVLRTEHAGHALCAMLGFHLGRMG